MKRFHVHMHVDDLPKNIAFYSAMFNQPPARTEATMPSGCWKTAGELCDLHPR
jgi:predicted enzyme related to lactoylglutathione lyase